MNIEQKIKKIEQEIKDLNLTKGLNLNSSKVAIVLGVSPSTIAEWRKNGLGAEYIAVPTVSKKAKKIARVMYPISNVAKWIVQNEIKTV